MLQPHTRAPAPRQRAGRTRSIAPMLLILSLLAVAFAAPVSAQDEDEEPYRLSHERSRLFFYGDGGSGGYQEWPMWNHARNSDPASDDSVGETNAFIPGDPNNGGGTRQFTFDGNYPSNVTVELDPTLPLTGQMRLNIFCQGTCSKDVTLYLRLDGQDLTQLTLTGPDEGTSDIYSFEFYPDIAEIQEGETLGLRVEFTKPGQPGDGYTLYLGPNNFQIDVPVLPPETTDIPDTILKEGEDWTTPYAKSEMGFTTADTGTVSLVMPIVLIIILIGIGVALIMLTPELPMKAATVSLVTLSMIVSAGVAPLVSWYDVYEHSNHDTDPNVYTVADLALLDQEPGTFLGDLTPGSKFDVWVEFEPDEPVYIKQLSDGNTTLRLYGLAHRMHDDALSDLEGTTLKGREAAQLYFSLIYAPPQADIDKTCANGDTMPNASEEEAIRACQPFDPEQGAGILLYVTLVEGPGGTVIPSESADSVLMMGDGTPRAAIPWYSVKVMGQPETWQFYPLLSLLPAAGLTGYGVYVAMQDRQLEEVWEDDDDWEDD